MNMKVIKKDNMDRENISDSLVCENCNEYYATMIADLLNKQAGETSPDWYVSVRDDYKLYQFSP